MAEQKEKNWHKYTIVCPRCSRPIIMRSLAFTSDGVIEIDGFCETCRLRIGWTGEIIKIMAECYKAEEARKARGERAEEDEKKRIRRVN